MPLAAPAVLLNANSPLRRRHVPHLQVETATAALENAKIPCVPLLVSTASAEHMKITIASNRVYLTTRVTS